MVMKVVELKEIIYSYQTGKFPYISIKGIRYIMIVHHTDANYILSKRMSNRTESQMLKTYERIIMRIKTKGLGPKKHVLENEISK